MKTTKQRIEDLFELTDKKEIAKEIDDLLNDFTTSVLSTVDKEFLIQTENDFSTIASLFYISPPAVGEKIIIQKDVYEVKCVVHSSSRQYPGFIIVRKTSENSSKYYENFI